jgi:hypothetical protein
MSAKKRRIADGGSDELASLRPLQPGLTVLGFAASIT